MKTTIFISLLLSATLFSYGQKADSLAKKAIKIKNVDGTNMSSAKGLVDNLSASPDFTTLVGLIKASGLADQLNSGIITFLAPTNKAFAKLPAGTIDSNNNSEKIGPILKVPGHPRAIELQRPIKIGKSK